MRQRSPLKFACLVAALLAGCATGNHGWTGKGATPFDTAQADCDTKTQDLPAGKQREGAFDQCMEEHGWRRP
ncbi:hypothetical protein LVB87_14015 [Lysobacter sp. KIS68-7]|uniref:hypothetical protein n=1 Tax=Lysobacter sp. KIS68-7 TaxID=2904252 RepID=UPI001E5082B1|nr:hypothetical protein [Lysobacter sp. KIS68-7]UHQ19283.1 hypothetical protein LVB87_14015 [Lysobacter sp. KIS68-7]